MSFFEIQGGRPLSGAVSVHGAKNSVLPILAATILARGTTVIHNCPNLSDVRATIEILRLLGCFVQWEGDTVAVNATNITCTTIPSRLMGEMRSSVLFMGALMGRMGCATLCPPGGCQLGDRPIDLHLSGLRKLGATICEDSGIYCSGKLCGREIYLPFPSVGATENLILAACGATGTTTIIGGAREPEIWDLQQCLRGMGADISGAGSSVITIHGGKDLHPTTHRVIGDRIVAATYLCCCGAAGGEIHLAGIDPNHLSAITFALERSGCQLQVGEGEITLTSSGRMEGVSVIRTAPYPGFPTDAQAIFMGALAGGGGSTLFSENIFDSRYRHVGELRRMGADIQLDGRVAVVTGVDGLCGATLHGTDLRCGAALVTAAMGAEGKSRVYGLSHIHRGYVSLDGDLRRLGGDIQLIEE